VGEDGALHTRALEFVDEAALEREQREIEALAKELLEAARAPATRRAYDRAFARFEAWCERRGHSPWAPDTVARYLTFRVHVGKRPSTVEQDLAAIAAKYQGQRLSAPRGVGLRRLSQGIRRTLGVAPRQKAPLLPEDLAAMVAKLPSTLQGERDRALLLVGFAGAFRRSELVSLDVEDLSWSNGGVSVTLRRSKTDQTQKGAVVDIPEGVRRITCPVAALRAWLEASGIGTGAVFREVTRGDRLAPGRLWPGALARVVKRAVAAAGLDEADFSGHSLRAGFLTAAARAGRRLEDIMRQSRHRSVATAVGYIRKAGAFEDNAAKGLL
jgi:integrase